MDRPGIFTFVTRVLALQRTENGESGLEQSAFPFGCSCHHPAFFPSQHLSDATFYRKHHVPNAAQPGDALVTVQAPRVTFFRGSIRKLHAYSADRSAVCRNSDVERRPRFAALHRHGDKSSAARWVQTTPRFTRFRAAEFVVWKFLQRPHDPDRKSAYGS